MKLTRGRISLRFTINEVKTILISYLNAGDMFSEVIASTDADKVAIDFTYDNLYEGNVDGVILILKPTSETEK